MRTPISRRNKSLTNIYLGLISLGFFSSYCSAEEKIYLFETTYIADYFKNFSGGYQQAGTYLDQLNLNLDINSEQLWNISESSVHIHVIYNNNNRLNDIVGDAQGVSNIDNSTMLRIHELWFEKISGQHSLKFGIYDLNSEFDAIESAGFFINSSHGIGPDYSQSGESGPSIFPATSLALRYRNQLSANFSVQAAVVDAVPGKKNDPISNAVQLGGSDGALIALEANYSLGDSRFAIGHWYYSKESVYSNGLGQDNNRGIYALAEKRYVSSVQNFELTGWLRFGRANDSVNQFEQYFGSGIVLTHFIDSRPEDGLGFAIAKVTNSNKFRAINFGLETNETVFELSYSTVINSHFRIQPDIQLIKNPATDPTFKDALVLGIRLESSF